MLSSLFIFSLSLSFCSFSLSLPFHSFSFCSFSFSCNEMHPSCWQEANNTVFRFLISNWIWRNGRKEATEWQPERKRLNGLSLSLSPFLSLLSPSSHFQSIQKSVFLQWKSLLLHLLSVRVEESESEREKNSKLMQPQNSRVDEIIEFWVHSHFLSFLIH